MSEIETSLVSEHKHKETEIGFKTLIDVDV